MIVPWNHDRCILCLHPASLTLEHIIPASLGGKLMCRFLCQSCNSDLGSGIESGAKFNPVFHREIERLPTELNDLKRRLLEGQSYETVGAGPVVRGRIRNGQFVAQSKRMSDGSLVQGEAEAMKTLRSMMQHDGLDSAGTEHAMNIFRSAPLGVSVELAPGLSVINWGTDDIRPTLDGPSPNALAPVKSAFEFLALHLNTTAYYEGEPFESIRSALISNQSHDERVAVEWFRADNDSHFHGLFFESTAPYVVIQVRYFGRIAARVHFKALAVGGPRLVYTHHLLTDAEGIEETASSASERNK